MPADISTHPAAGSSPERGVESRGGSALSERSWRGATLADTATPSVDEEEKSLAVAPTLGRKSSSFIDRFCGGQWRRMAALHMTGARTQRPWGEICLLRDWGAASRTCSFTRPWRIHRVGVRSTHSQDPRVQATPSHALAPAAAVHSQILFNSPAAHRHSCPLYVLRCELSVATDRTRRRRQGALASRGAHDARTRQVAAYGDLVLLAVKIIPLTKR